MKQGGVASREGFTIVESLVVLAVTGALALMAFTYVSGRQAKTQFTVATFNAKQQLEQIINETNSGYSPTSSLLCTAPPAGGRPSLSSSGGVQGTNTGCTFLGRAIQYVVPPNYDQYITYPIIGRQSNASPNYKPVSTLAQAIPTAVAAGYTINNGFTGGLEELTQLQDSLTVYSLKYFSALQNQYVDVGAFAYISNLASVNNSGNTTSGTQSFNLYAIKASGSRNIPALNGTPGVIDALDDYNNYIATNEIKLCLTDGTSQALIQIGDTANNSQSTVTLTQYPGGVCP